MLRLGLKKKNGLNSGTMSSNALKTAGRIRVIGGKKTLLQSGGLMKLRHGSHPKSGLSFGTMLNNGL